MTRSIVLLTGPIGSGKTTACARLVDRMRRDGLRVGGILAAALIDSDGAKMGIEAVDLLSGARRILATVEAYVAQSLPPMTRVIRHGRFLFDVAALDWANDRVRDALDAHLDLVTVDEIGPLELDRGAGLAPALHDLPTSSARSVVLIVRSQLHDRLYAQLESLAPLTVKLSVENRDTVPDLLRAALVGGA